LKEKAQGLTEFLSEQRIVKGCLELTGSRDSRFEKKIEVLIFASESRFSILIALNKFSL